MSLFNIYIDILTWGGKKGNKKLLRSDAAPWKASRNPVPAACRSDVQVVGGANEGLGRGRALSLGTGSSSCSLNWHQFPPSPAGPASVPCSTEPPTGTTYTQKTWRHCSSSVVKKQKDVFVMLAPLLLDLWGTVHKIMAPELKGRVLDQLNEGDEQTPWVRPVHNQPLQQDPCMTQFSQGYYS